MDASLVNRVMSRDLEVAMRVRIRAECCVRVGTADITLAVAKMGKSMREAGTL